MEENTTPPQPEPSGASSSTPQSLEKTGQPASMPQAPLEEQNPTKTSKWKTFWNRTRIAWFLFGEVLTLLWSLALWDSYRPKITVTPGGTLNAKSPVATYFIVQNQGALSIANIRYLTRLQPLQMPGSPNQSSFMDVEQNVSVIQEMNSLESYSLTMRHPSIYIGANHSPTASNQIVMSNLVQAVGLLLTFEISYDPKWYWRRVETLHFTGFPDADGNWQWLPSAHQSITEQTIDTNLLPRLPVAPPPAPAPATIQNTNNVGTQVHTN